jgi:hypothetical protein
MSKQFGNSSGNFSASSPAFASKPTLCHLSKLLEGYPDTEDEVKSTILALQAAYPSIPTLQINAPDGPWPTLKPHYVHKSHILTEEENIRIAVENIARTDRTLDETEMKFLCYILCYPSGWSATSPKHHEDAWVHYIKHRFSHIDNLQPILDDMTWPEEIELLAGDYGTGFPNYLLFANPTSFYFYHFDTDWLLRAGNTLEEVYWGLRQRRWTDKEERRWCGEDYSLEMWEIEPNNEEEYDRYDYFPVWTGGENGNSGDTEVLSNPLQPFIPQTR